MITFLKWSNPMAGSFLFSPDSIQMVQSLLQPKQIEMTMYLVRSILLYVMGYRSTTTPVAAMIDLPAALF